MLRLNKDGKKKQVYNARVTILLRPITLSESYRYLLEPYPMLSDKIKNRWSILSPEVLTLS